MVYDPKSSTTIELLIVGGLHTISLVFGEGALPGLLAASVGSVASELTAHFVEKGFERWRDHLLAQNKMLSGRQEDREDVDISQVLSDTFRRAVRSLERAWQEGNHYKLLLRENRDYAEHTLEILRGLRADADSFLGKPGGLAEALQSDDAKMLLRRDNAEVSGKLDQALDEYFHNHDANLVAFVKGYLSVQWLLYFVEYLKSERGTRAWRACQWLWHDSLQAGVDALERQSIATAEEIKQTRDLVEWLKDWASRLTGLPDEVRELTGDNVLTVLLDDVRKSLDVVKDSLLRIEQHIVSVKEDTRATLAATLANQEINTQTTHTLSEIAEQVGYLPGMGRKLHNVELILSSLLIKVPEVFALPALSGQLPPPPYPGMNTFREETGHFYGRDGEITEMLAHFGVLSPNKDMELTSGGFLLLIGPSGCGKSSLVFAGLIPKLKTSNNGPINFWVVRDIRPGSVPGDELVQLLRADPSDWEGTVARYLEAANQPGAKRLLLVVDQLEEVFSQAKLEEQKRFFAYLLALRSLPTCAIVLTLRSDFYDDLVHSDLWVVAKFEKMEIDPLGVNALRVAITEPAAEVGIIVQDGLVERLVAHTAGEPGGLPLLQETLVLLWPNIEGQVLPLHAYLRIGGEESKGLAVAVARKAEQVLADLVQQEGAVAEVLTRRIFLRLIQSVDAPRYTRRQRKVKELREERDDAALFDRVLNKLIKARLLTSSGRETVEKEHKAKDEAQIDLAHEAMITGWPRLKSWVDGWWLAEQTWQRLKLRVDNWTQFGRRLRGLLHAEELPEAQNWLNSAYAAESGVNVADLRTLVRRSSLVLSAQRWAIPIVFTIMLVLLVTIGYVMVDRQRAEERAMYVTLVNRVQSLGTDAVTQIQERNLEDGLRTAMEAVSITRQLNDPLPSLPETALHMALASPPPILRWDLRAHIEGVHSAVYSPNGKYIVTAGYDQRAFIWDAEEGKRLHMLEVGTHAVTSASFSPDNDYVVTSSTDSKAKIWEVATGNLVRTLNGHERAVWSASYSPSGKYIVTAGNDNTARVWNAKDGTAVFTMTMLNDRGNEVRFRSAAFGPNDNVIVTANEDGNVRIWRADEVGESWILERELTGHRDLVTQAVFSRDGKYIVSASEDSTVKVWNTGTWEVRTLSGHTSEVRSAAFSHDNRHIITADSDRLTKIWDTSSWELLLNVRLHDNAIWGAAFSPDGHNIITASEDQTAKVWNFPNEEELATLRGHTNGLSRSTYSPDGMQVVTASVDKTARVWDSISGRTVHTLTGHEDFVFSAVFSPDGMEVLTASRDGTAKIWDLSSEQPIQTLTGHESAVNSAMYRPPDGKQVVTAGSDRTARIWEVGRDKEMHILEGHDGVVHSAAYSPNGKLIATASSDGTVKIWDAETGGVVRTSDTLTVPIISALFNPDGTQLVISSGTVASIWDVESLKEYRTFTGHKANVNSASFSPDGKFIVTSSEDGTARIWYAATGEQRTILRGHRGWLRGAAYRPDGRSIVTSSDDYTARQYCTDIEELLKLAQTRITLQGTTEEICAPK